MDRKRLFGGPASYTLRDSEKHPAFCTVPMLPRSIARQEAFSSAV